MSKLPCDDPVYRNTLREALTILLLWGGAFIWVISYCWAFGYREIDPDDLQIVLGVPSWVFWGVGFPWCLCAIASIAMSVWFIHDDDLGAVAEEDPEGGEAG